MADDAILRNSITMNAAIKEAYELAPADITFYDTLEIIHSSFSESIKVVNSYIPLSTNQGIFIPCLFDITLPETEGKVRGEMSITINFLPKASQALVMEAAQTSDPVTIKYRQYTTSGSDPDAELPTTLNVSTISQVTTGIKISAMFPDLEGMIFPRRIMTTTILPGGL